MSIVPKTFYAVECDEPGCSVTTADLGDFAAWADAGSAETEWVEAGGELVDRNGGTRHFCEEHASACEDEDDEPASPPRLTTVETRGGLL